MIYWKVGLVLPLLLIDAVMRMFTQQIEKIKIEVRGGYTWEDRIDLFLARLGVFVGGVAIVAILGLMFFYQG